METFFKNIAGEEGTKERLVKDLITLVHDAEELVKATGGDIAEKSKEEIMEATLRAADQVIRRHPYESMGVVFGVGILLGVLINRD